MAPFFPYLGSSSFCGVVGSLAARLTNLRYDMDLQESDIDTFEGSQGMTHRHVSWCFLLTHSSTILQGGLANGEFPEEHGIVRNPTCSDGPSTSIDVSDGWSWKQLPMSTSSWNAHQVETCIMNGQFYWAAQGNATFGSWHIGHCVVDDQY